MNDFRLVWKPGTAPAELNREQLADLYGYPDQTWLRGSMVSSIDGSAVGGDGRSASVSSAADRAMLSLLRGLCDVVLVGAATAREEGYERTVAKPAFAARRAELGQAAAPTIAVVTRSGSIDPRLLHSQQGDQVGELLVLTTESVSAAVRQRLESVLGTERVISCGALEVEPAKAVAALAERGLHRIQCEGGPSWLALVAAAGLLDDLCLTTSPLLIAGEGSRIVNGPPIEQGAMRLEHLVLSGDSIFTRWLVRHS